MRWLLRIALGVLLAGLLGFLLRVPVLRAAGAFLVVSDPPRRADAIVMLGGSIPDRILHAVDLYRAGFAPRIFLTRAKDRSGTEELRRRGVALPERYEMNRSIAEKLGVPGEDIVVVELRVSSTIAEAIALVRELRRRGVRSFLLVTSKTHTRRAAALFRFVNAGELEIAIVPTPYDPFSADDWWRHRAIARRVVTEYGKWLFFQLVDRWRVTVPAPAEALS